MKPESSLGVSSETALLTDKLLSRRGRHYGNALLKSLGRPECLLGLSDHPAIAWKRSGLLDTTKLMLPLDLVSHVDGALMALNALAPKADLPCSGALLMGERARLRETVRQGRQCAGGYGRLLDARDGRIALNLVREDDWDLIPAWLQDYAEDWDGITRIVKHRDMKYLVERAGELGLAVAVDSLPERPESWLDVKRFTPAAPKAAPLIVDLSGLWAGPLASSLLQMCGARVVKVEGPNRPDGMRNGHKGFYELLNAGKDCAAFDFRNADELADLKGLLSAADIVIEASRPRALRQMGIIAEDYVGAKPGKIWARLTAYGQKENRIGFGDDIGVTAGLTRVMEAAYDEVCFVGDAIADPVNGVHLALAIWATYQNGGGAVIDLSMADVLRYAMGDILPTAISPMRIWGDFADADTDPLYQMRKPKGVTQALGANTQQVLASLC